jgi:hypothetical protein
MLINFFPWGKKRRKIIIKKEIGRNAFVPNSALPKSQQVTFKDEVSSRKANT